MYGFFGFSGKTHHEEAFHPEMIGLDLLYRNADVIRVHARFMKFKQIRVAGFNAQRKHQAACLF